MDDLTLRKELVRFMKRNADQIVRYRELYPGKSDKEIAVALMFAEHHRELETDFNRRKHDLKVQHARLLAAIQLEQVKEEYDQKQRINPNGP